MLGTSCGVADLEAAELGNSGQSSCVQATVDWYGPTDGLLMDEESIADSCVPFHDKPGSPESQYLGGPIQMVPEIAEAANPITYVTSDDPPFFIQHGTEDCTVPYQQSQLLYDALAPAIGADNVTLMFLEGFEHGDPRFVAPSNVALVLDFLDERFK
jgi:dipeptidyl aminopeptidase/acylaminoacyl peptidase